MCVCTYSISLLYVFYLSFLRILSSLKLQVSFAQYRLFLQGSFAKETYNFKEPTSRSHPISAFPPPESGDFVHKHKYACMRNSFMYVYFCNMFVSSSISKILRVHVRLVFSRNFFCSVSYMYIDTHSFSFVCVYLYLHTHNNFVCRCAIETSQLQQIFKEIMCFLSTKTCTHANTESFFFF